MPKSISCQRDQRCLSFPPTKTGIMVKTSRSISPKLPPATSLFCIPQNLYRMTILFSLHITHSNIIPAPRLHHQPAPSSTHSNPLGGGDGRGGREKGVVETSNVATLPHRLLSRWSQSRGGKSRAANYREVMVRWCGKQHDLPGFATRLCWPSALSLLISLLLWSHPALLLC